MLTLAPTLVHLVPPPVQLVQLVLAARRQQS